MATETDRRFCENPGTLAEAADTNKVPENVRLFKGHICSEEVALADHVAAFPAEYRQRILGVTPVDSQVTRAIEARLSVAELVPVLTGGLPCME